MISQQTAGENEEVVAVVVVCVGVSARQDNQAVRKNKKWEKFK